MVYSCMVKLLRSAGWNGATTEINFLNKKVLVVSLCVSLYVTILCEVVKGLLCSDFWVLYIMQLSLVLSFYLLKTVWKTFAGS